MSLLTTIDSKTDAQFLRSFRKAFRRIDDEDRRLLLYMAGRMAHKSVGRSPVSDRVLEFRIRQNRTRESPRLPQSNRPKIC
jgi:hypothetical protein